jgi:hypothetical protein
MLSSRCSIELLYFDCSGHREHCDRIINGDDVKFDRVLGPGSAKEIADIIDCCSNMNGAKPPGSKVGLIDEYHI